MNGITIAIESIVVEKPKNEESLFLKRNNKSANRTNVHTPKNKEVVKSLLNSSFTLLKNDIDKYPWLDKAIKYVQKVTIVLNKVRLPYSAGSMNLARRISKKKLIP